MRHLNPWNLLPIAKDLLVLLVGGASAFWAWYRTRHAPSWPSAQGTVMSAAAHRTGDSYLRPWTVVLTYSYTVNGEYYSGFRRFRARTEHRADELTNDWKGRSIVIRYSPGKPDLSTLLVSDQPGGQLAF